MFKMQLPEQLTPTWKMLLLSDGSVTRHLQLLTGQHIDVVTAVTSCFCCNTLCAPYWRLSSGVAVPDMNAFMLSNSHKRTQI